MLPHPSGKSADDGKRAVGGNGHNGNAVTDFAGAAAVVPPGAVTAVEAETFVQFGILFHSADIGKNVNRQKNTDNQCRSGRPDGTQLGKTEFAVYQNRVDDDIENVGRNNAVHADIRAADGLKEKVGIDIH